MRIELTLDIDDEVENSIDYVGTIKINDGIREIKVRYTFIDSWLLALLEILTSNKSHEGEIEIPEERYPLKYKFLTEDSVRLDFTDSWVIVNSIRDACVELKIEFEKFLAKLRQFNFNENDAVHQIKKEFGIQEDE